jgi:adenine/guanine phosphoribosyltransferase-like PRPP-binding protein
MIVGCDIMLAIDATETLIVIDDLLKGGRINLGLFEALKQCQFVIEGLIGDLEIANAKVDVLDTEKKLSDCFKHLCSLEEKRISVA